jgi:hypothetical protein
MFKTLDDYKSNNFKYSHSFIENKDDKEEKKKTTSYAGGEKRYSLSKSN